MNKICELWIHLKRELTSDEVSSCEKLDGPSQNKPYYIPPQYKRTLVLHELPGFIKKHEYKVSFSTLY